ncbi:hypothetical protein Leryth_023630 [Lithospermum erythrorhizon]|nr:hypothetical protein Leryth_023630 [Lithospermum erythrorhizon]
MADHYHGAPTNLSSLLSSPDRDFLVRNNGDKVKVESLKDKIVGLYFSASWCPPCQGFTPYLIEAYNELLPKGNFEIVFVSSDHDEESFQGYFEKMPWLAVPFSDSDVRERLDQFFKVNGIPHFVVLDDEGAVLTDSGVEIIREYGAEGYPFSRDRINELKEQEDAAKRAQTLCSILVSPSRNYVLSSDGKQTPVSELEGKIVGLYFAISMSPFSAFTPILNDLYTKLKEKEENFEIVVIPLDDDEEEFKQAFENLTWFSLPVKDKTCEKLVRYFEVHTLPTLVIIGPDGKTLQSNAAEAIEEHGFEAYPFTPEKFSVLKEIEKAKLEAQTLESVLVSGDLNFVIGKGGLSVPVSDLVGKHILLYFSAKWCPPCRAFLPKLIKAYHEIKAKDNAFEVIFISSDKDQSSFDEFYSEMPWLALPFGDDRKKKLSRLFKVTGIPMLVALGPTGRTITTLARKLVSDYGANAYPFTEDRLKEIEAQYEEMAKGWPEKLNHKLHEEHELVLTRRDDYCCDSCDDTGTVYSFYCEECDFDLHPKCALEDEKPKDMDAEEKKQEEGWVCEGDVCRKA